MNCIIINRDKTLFEAARKMGELNIGSLIVDDNDEHLGIFTERDLLRAVARGVDLNFAQVGDFCTYPIISIDQNSNLGLVSSLMLEKKIRRLPLHDGDGNIVGMCSIRDILNAIHNSFLSILNH